MLIGHSFWRVSPRTPHKSNVESRSDRWTTKPAKTNDRSRAAGLKWAAALFFLGLTLGVSSPCAADSPPAAIVPGQSNVTATGAFTYTIPIAVPPGTAGMVPALSLDYSSQNGDGLEGLGWTLSGLPVITRCPQTPAEDSGTHGAVNYDSNDRFCLNGTRLVSTSGTYGDDGSQYDTEIETFSRVVYHKIANQLDYFTVTTKSGMVYELGNTSDSNILAVSAAGGTMSAARAWAVDKITDTKGNYLTVTYTNDTTNGQFYPTEVDYTGNGSVNPYNSVKFSYSSRSDVTPKYQAGGVVKITKLLTDIKTYQGVNLVLDYQLVYALDGLQTHSRLTSVTLCDNSGTSCLAPTTFTWQGGPGTLTDNATSETIAQGHTLLSGDLNGDGLTDALVLIDGSCSTGDDFLGSQSGSFTAGSLTADYYYTPYHNSTVTHYSGALCFPSGSNGGGAPQVIADFTGDGVPDIFMNQRRWAGSTGDWTSTFNEYPLSNDGSGNVSNPNTTSSYYPYTNFGDFNGDGRTDGFMMGHAQISNGNGTFTFDLSHSVTETPVFGDFDGDGCTDALASGSPGTVTYYCNPAIATASTPYWSGFTLITGDFNGDGKTDVLTVSSSTTGAEWHSTGTGFIRCGFNVSTGWASYKIVTGDFNGDGMTDIALISQTSGTPHAIYLSTGCGFVQAATISNGDASVTAVVADWNNDGADDLWLQKSSGDTLHTFTYVPELMTGVSNGIGASVSVSYDRLNKNGSFYTKGTGAIYPIQDMDGAYYVVSQLGRSNGVGGTYNLTYAYSGAKFEIDRAGLARPGWMLLTSPGFLGFTSVTVSDPQTNIVTATSYRTDFPNRGKITSQTVTHGTVTLQSVANSYVASPDGGDEVVLSTSTVTANDVDGAALPTYLVDYLEYDSYNDPTTIKEYISGTLWRTTTNTYYNDTADSILGKLLSTSVESVVGSSDTTRTSYFCYDFTSSTIQLPSGADCPVSSGNSGLLTQEIAEPNVNTCNAGGSDPCTLTANFTLDAFGNRTSTQLLGTSLPRTTSVGYDSKGQFATTVTNALSQSQSLGYDARFGAVDSYTDLNDQVATATYDSFGRRTTAVRPDGNKVSTTYSYCSGVNGGTAWCPALAAYVEVVTPKNASGAQNGAQSKIYFDALSRVIVKYVQGFDGSWIRADAIYDANGRIHQTSRPYFATGGTAEYTTYTYDDLGRVTNAQAPDSSNTAYTYDGLTRTVTDDKGHTTTTVLNNQGLVASVTDAANHTITYTYDAFGDLTKVVNSGNTTTNTYDIRGRKVGSSDPDMGSWSYSYDVLNELTSQTDARGTVTSLSYDALGRPYTRTETPTSGPTLTTTWTWDGATKGMLASVSGPQAGYVRTMTYDSLSRPLSATLSIWGNTYVYTAAYNGDGRLSSLAYPSGLTVNYNYNSDGYLTDLDDAATSTALWKVNARDAEMHALDVTLGTTTPVDVDQVFDAATGRLIQVHAGSDPGTFTNLDTISYSWDTVGRLTMRSDTLEGTTEKFCYSQIDALVNSSFGSACTDTSTGSYHVGLSYTANGNIASKSDIGTYSYGGAGAGAHAVSSIDTTAGCSLSACTVNGVSNPSFTYNANGNMTAGAGRTLTYTPFNMAATITQGSSTYTLYYDDTHSRIAQVGPSTTTLYLNALGGMSELASSGSTLTWHDFIVADGQLVAERFCTGSAPCASSGATLKYFVTDHLGSIAMVLNDDGSMAEHLSFDSWGMRRNADGSPASCGAISSSTTRGYTGQEEMDGLCLVNMNARLYDPEIGRFQSADSIIPDPLNMQSFNRYSYVLNNPLAYTDPTGHEDNSEGQYGSNLQSGQTNYDGGGGVDETVTVTAQRIHEKPEMGQVGGMSPYNNSDRASHGADRDHSGETKDAADKKERSGAACPASAPSNGDDNLAKAVTATTIRKALATVVGDTLSLAIGFYFASTSPAC